MLCAAFGLQAQTPDSISIDIDPFGSFKIEMPNCDSVPTGNEWQAQLNLFRYLFSSAFSGVTDGNDQCQNWAVVSSIMEGTEIRDELCELVRNNQEFYSDFLEYEFSDYETQLLPEEPNECDLILTWVLSQTSNTKCNLIQDRIDFEEFKENCNTLMSGPDFLSALNLENPTLQDTLLLLEDSCRQWAYCEYQEKLAEQNDTIAEQNGVVLDTTFIMSCDSFLIEELGAEKFALLSTQERINYCLQKEKFQSVLDKVGVSLGEGAELLGFGSNCWVSQRVLFYLGNLDSLNLFLEVGGTESLMGNSNAYLGITGKYGIFYGTLGANMTFNTIREPSSSLEDYGSSWLYGTPRGSKVNEIGLLTRLGVKNTFFKKEWYNFNLGTEVEWNFHSQEQETVSHGHLMLSIGKEFRLNDKLSFELGGWAMPVHASNNGRIRTVLPRDIVPNTENVWNDSQIFGVYAAMKLSKRQQQKPKNLMPTSTSRKKSTESAKNYLELKQQMLALK